MTSGERYLLFLQGTGTDQTGRTMDEILAWDDDRLERVHDYIQWLFPIPSGSGVNPDAPVLDPTTAAEAARSPDRILRALDRMLAFYGFARDGDEIGPHDGVRRPWMAPRDHNHLRLTRILTHLREVGLHPLARSLQHRILEVEGPSERSHSFWRQAA